MECLAALPFSCASLQFLQHFRSYQIHMVVIVATISELSVCADPGGLTSRLVGIAHGAEQVLCVLDLKGLSARCNLFAGASKVSHGASAFFLNVAGTLGEVEPEPLRQGDSE